MPTPARHQTWVMKSQRDPERWLANCIDCEWDRLGEIEVEARTWAMSHEDEAQVIGDGGYWPPGLAPQPKPTGLQYGRR